MVALRFRLICVLCLCSLSIWQSITRSAAPVAEASNRQSNATRYSGPPELVAALNQNTAQPLSLAAADVDEDGILDVIAGYGTAGRGLVAVQRGNAAALYPHSPKAQAQRAAGFVSDLPFLPDAVLTDLPEAPAFMTAADFTGDGHADVLVGAAGSSLLYLLQGDGHGGLAKARPIALPGSLSGLLSGEFDAPDGLSEVVVTLDGPAGPHLAIYASPHGALADDAPPTLVSLPASALDVTLGHFEGDARPSLAVLTGKQLLLFHGRASAAFNADQGAPTLETRDLAFQAMALTAGNFSGAELELAILARDGRLFLASPHTPTSQPTSVHSGVMEQAAVDGVAMSRPAPVSQNSTLLQPMPLSKWQIQPVLGATRLPSTDRLVRAQRAAGDADGLAIVVGTASSNISTANTRLLSLRSGSDIASPALPSMIAAISMRVSPDARQGLVYLSVDSSVPQVLLPAAGSTFTVNLTGDAADPNPADGLCDTDLVTVGDQCTLRAAIIQANALGGPATIQFAIGSGLQKIAPTTQLPNIVVPLTIDGTTQPGYTNAPLIQLSGESQPTGSGLIIGNASTVRGLDIGNFQGNGILIRGATGGNIIENNYVGTDPTGTITNPNGLAGGAAFSYIPAIGVFNSPNNTVGGTNAAARNLISGNSGSGVVLAEAGSHGNVVQGNYIGADATGLVALGNGLNGVAIDCSNTPGSVSGHDNLVGGLSPGAANVISANWGAGVAIECASANANLVQGNYIGTNYLGTTELPGSSPAAGVLLLAYRIGGVRNNVIGGATSSARNIIAGNTSNGLVLAADPATQEISVTLNQVSSNYIGVNIAGAALPNLWTGIRMNAGAIDNLIGGARSGLTCDSPGNVISGNLLDGVALSGVQKNRVQGNCIGVGPNGVTTVANHQAGVVIDRGSTQNLIGGDRSPGLCQDVCNTIAGNVTWGVVLSDTNTLSNTVRANDIHGNGKLGIDLIGGAYDVTTGVTANRPDLIGLGPNGLTFFPVGVMGTYDPAINKTLISGILASSHPASATIDLYANSAVDISGFGEGEDYLGRTTPQASGVFTFAVAGHLPKLFVSATATDEHGATSEFGPVCGDPDGNGNIDDDGDGLCDDWEIHGIYFDGHSGAPDLNLPGLGADPERKDVFVEADYMIGEKPMDAALQQLVLSFALSPVTNPVGHPNGIALHFVGDAPGGYLDEAVDYASVIHYGSRGLGLYDDFQDIKLGSSGNPCGTGPTDGHFGTISDRGWSWPDCANVLGAKRLAFRYMLFGHTFSEGVNNSGVAFRPGQDILVTVTADSWQKWATIMSEHFTTTVSSEAQDLQAGTIMHELGHSLGLGHGGSDEFNCKPNYLSVMSYAYQANNAGRAHGLPNIANNAWVRSDRPLSYSSKELLPLYKGLLAEADGIGGPAGRRALWGWGGQALASPADGPIDWNGNGVIDPSVLANAYDINWLTITGCPPNNPPGDLDPLNGYDDWSNLTYNFRASLSYVRGAYMPAAGGPVMPVELNQTQYVDGSLGTNDYDQDGILNVADNCPLVANPAQTDSNGDSIGDACSLAALSFTPSQVQPGQLVTGTVTLAQPAPADGAYLILTATQSLTSGLPLTLTIPASATQKQFQLTAPDVQISTTVTVTVSWALHTVTGTLTIAPADRWRLVHSMAGPHTEGTATVLGDGTVLVAGGRSQYQYGAPYAFAGAERYDPHTDTWTPAGAMATKRSNHTATLLKSGDVLVVGGLIEDPQWPRHDLLLASAELYHPITNTWTPAGQMASVRSGHTATLLPSGKVLVVGGSGYGIEAWNAELYDPLTNSWSTVAGPQYHRSQHSTVLLPSSLVLVAGGVDLALRHAELYNPLSNTWQLAGTMVYSDSRYNATATLLPTGEVLFAGGNEQQGTAELFNPATKSWRAAAPLPHPRTKHSATLLPSGQVLVAGGYYDDAMFPYPSNSASTMLYDPQSNTWRTLPNLNQPRGNHAAVLLTTGQVLVVGGSNGIYAQGPTILSSAETYMASPVQPVRLLMYLPLVRR